MKNEMESYGGQALIEGVLMRGKHYLAAAFRLPNGAIEKRIEKVSDKKEKQIWKLPFFRGIRVLIDSLLLGMKYLGISASLQSGDDEDSPVLVPSALLISLAFSIGLFFVLPALIAEIINKLLRLNPWIFNIVEGVVRLFILIIYLMLIGKVDDIQRVFAYHGAEHKTINAFENGTEMNIKKIAEYSTAHQRCGTSFLLTLVVLSIFMFSLFGPLPLLNRIILRIALVPILASISYETIRLMGKHENTALVKLLSMPNLALQKLTTREPSEDMIEVAFTAFQTLIEHENNQES